MGAFLLLQELVRTLTSSGIVLLSWTQELGSESLDLLKLRTWGVLLKISCFQGTLIGSRLGLNESLHSVGSPNYKLPVESVVLLVAITAGEEGVAEHPVVDVVLTIDIAVVHRADLSTRLLGLRIDATQQAELVDAANLHITLLVLVEHPNGEVSHSTAISTIIGTGPDNLHEEETVNEEHSRAGTLSLRHVSSSQGK